MFLSIPQAVAAGLALAILSGTVGAQWSRIGDDPEAEQQANSSGAESAAWVRWVAEADPSLEGRAREVARLEAALLGEGQLTDPTAVQVVQRNLAVIDRAIQESASALLRDPGNRFLGQSLARALQARADYVGQAASLTFPAT